MLSTDMQGQKIVIANWKMSLDLQGSISLTEDLLKVSEDADWPEHTVAALCPSFDALAIVSDLLEGSRFIVGAQDIFWQERGAYTGEVSASMVAACGARLVIIGHSERRTYLKENDAIVNKKIKAALAARLVPVVCVGETYEERSGGHTDLVLTRQVIEGLRGILLKSSDRIIIAYEPVWVIGTGQAIDPPMVAHASDVIQQALIDVYSGNALERQTSIIYGGSVDEVNIGEYVGLPNIRGVLVGTASLNARTFCGLIESLRLC